MSINNLTRLHEVELEIMDEFDRICNKHGLTYFLDSGTALGAIRHKGFIPWDDDVDVAMPRRDYDRFIELVTSELSSRYFLQTNKSDPNFIKLNAKIRKKGTIFPERGSEKYAQRGIFIDIYPFDYVSDNEDKALAEIAMARKWSHIYRTRRTWNIHRPFLHRILALMTTLIPLSYIELKLRKIYYRYSKAPTSTVTCHSYKMSLNKNLLFNIDDLIPTNRIQFENREYSIMNNPDNYLKIMYGEYMTLPPEEQRVCHLHGKIIFDDNTKTK